MKVNTTVQNTTRWYPRGIQQLVSTYELPETRGGAWGGCPDQLNSKCQDLSKSAYLGGGLSGPDQLNPKCQDLAISAFSGGRGWWSRPTQPKVLRSVQICIFGGGWREGGGGVQTNIPEILE